MTEEENKAVEFIKKEIKNLEEAKIEFSNEIEDKSWLRKNINELDKDIFYKNTLLNLIEKLQKENEKLKEKELIDRAMIEDSISKGIIERDYIPKDKIGEKLLVITDLKSKIDLSKEKTPLEFYVLDYANNLLVELLEEE